MWLKYPIVEKNGSTKGGKKNTIGTPQGGVISPLLANIYLNLLDKIVNKATGMFRYAGVEIIRYADDFVLMGREIPDKCIDYLKYLLGRMKLTLNTEKTKMLNAKVDSFDFLGFTFRYSKDTYGRNIKYWNVEPSAKSLNKIRANVSKCLKENGHCNPATISRKLNSKIVGWINYYTINNVSYPRKAQKKVRYHLMKRLNRYYALVHFY